MVHKEYNFMVKLHYDNVKFYSKIVMVTIGKKCLIK